MKSPSSLVLVLLAFLVVACSKKPDAPISAAATSETPAPPAQAPSLPYAKAVEGKPGFVTSPYAPTSGYIDIRGFPPGTEVKDPYSGKTFVVP